MIAAEVSPGRVHGRLRAPPSKSYTHRALIAAHLAGTRCRIRNPLLADDTARTASAVSALGSGVRRRPGDWYVDPDRASASSRRRTIDCGESGTTLRFVTAAAALEPTTVRFVGRGRLPERPMRPLLAALEKLGARTRGPEGRRTLPLEIEGPICGGTVTLDRSESSQFTSALLLTLPAARPDSVLRLRGRAVSEPYVEATLAVLASQGISVGRRSDRFLIPGGQTYRGGEISVPGDASSAAYLWAAAAVTGGSVEVAGIPAEWPQADLEVLELLTDYGATVERTADRVKVTGGQRRGFRRRFDHAPDLYPLAGVLAAAAPTLSVLEGGLHVATKESDRRVETERLARSMGARTVLTGRSLRINGTETPRALRAVRSHDHRIVMSASVAALAADGPSRIDDVRAVGKSFPTFFRSLAALGGSVSRSR